MYSYPLNVYKWKLWNNGRLVGMVLYTIWNIYCFMVRTWMAVTLPVTHHCMYALLTIKRLVQECFCFVVHNVLLSIMPIKLPIRYIFFLSLLYKVNKHRIWNGLKTLEFSISKLFKKLNTNITITNITNIPTLQIQTLNVEIIF